MPKRIHRFVQVLRTRLRVRPQSGPIVSTHTERQKRFLRGLAATRRVPTLTQFGQLPRLLNAKEKRVFFAAHAVGICALAFLLVWGYLSHLVLLPAHGGSYTEGLIGSPQFINPLYASANDTDQDLARLIYSGLMKWDPSAGLVPDLAESYTVSEDEKTYTFTLRPNALWHDGTHVTVRDLIFTFHLIQTPEYRSPLASAFQGVSIEQVDDQTVAFQLNEPFAPFLSSLTVGILPTDYWGDLDPTILRLAERNILPIGSGPYAVKELEKSKQGVVQSYTLKRFARYYGNEPNIETLTFKFYPDADAAAQALKEKRVEGIAFSPVDRVSELSALPGVRMYSPRLPQITAVFFNTKRDAVASADLRAALALATNKQQLVEEVLGGRGAVTHGPIIASYTTDSDVYADPHPFDLSAAGAALDALGWTLPEGETMRSKEDDGERTPLKLTLTLVEQPETRAIAEALQRMWAQAGIELELNAVDAATFRDTTLREHAYDILLSGILMGADPDVYPFWHSSQQNHPGLNLSQFANRDVDALIEKARGTSDIEARKEEYEQITALVNKTTPAIFLYQPTYSYLTSSRLRGVETDAIVVPSDRFGQVANWYLKTKRTFRWKATEGLTP